MNKAIQNLEEAKTLILKNKADKLKELERWQRKIKPDSKNIEKIAEKINEYREQIDLKKSEGKSHTAETELLRQLEKNYDSICQRVQPAKKFMLSAEEEYQNYNRILYLIEEEIRCEKALEMIFCESEF